ncbi:MAG: rod shape-determining protein [Flavobacteriaceae bacterium]|nr:rod shape-determining protein [Flavobacteriaceae bacterium]
MGQDAFKNGKISKKNIQRLLDSMKSFKLLMKVHNVNKYLAYATSALRSSSNSKKIIDLVEKKSNIKIEIISGQKEAKLITNNPVFSTKSKTFCFIDVGGGSTELTLINNNKVINSKSFKIGGVRLINNLVKKPTWDKFENWIVNNLSNKKNIQRLLDSMKSFKLLMKVHDVNKYLAYATSALRSSSNGKKIIDLVEKKCNIKIEIISGQKEAKLITNNPSFSTKSKTFCFIDVGGGSTELTLINNNKIINSKSFKIGGVRLINNLVNKSTWDKFENWIVNNLSNKKNIEVVALGGNINKIFKLSGNKIGKPISVELIDSTINDLEKMSFFNKMVTLKLNPDRVDVIVPAGKIYQFVLNKMDVKEITVPKIGLADGMVHELINEL